MSAEIIIFPGARITRERTWVDRVPCFIICIRCRQEFERVDHVAMCQGCRDNREPKAGAA